MGNRLRLVALVSILALLLIPLAAAAQSEKTEPRLISVQFNSRPEFAEVRVDGVFVGTTPLPYRLSPGVHKIELSRQRYQSWTRELFVSADVPTNVTALLDERESKPCGK
ncbi:MAG TPA: PEGA domain-containing protein [Thermoanaerobaculia bacterium]|nr:PEGA domain-containing protein [Thermoanaerobaculia bacterium]